MDEKTLLMAAASGEQFDVRVIGYQFGLREDWQTLCDPPPPGNRKEDTYRAALPGLWEAKARTMRKEMGLMTTEIVSVVLLDGKGQQAAGEPASPFASLVTELEGAAVSGAYIVSTWTHRLLRQLAWQRAQEGYTSPAWFWDVASSQYAHLCVDLYQLTGARNQGISQERMYRALVEGAGETLDRVAGNLVPWADAHATLNWYLLERVTGHTTPSHPDKTRAPA